MCVWLVRLIGRDVDGSFNGKYMREERNETWEQCNGIKRIEDMGSILKCGCRYVYIVHYWIWMPLNTWQNSALASASLIRQPPENSVGTSKNVREIEYQKEKCGDGMES